MYPERGRARWNGLGTQNDRPAVDRNGWGIDESVPETPEKLANRLTVLGSSRP